MIIRGYDDGEYIECLTWQDELHRLELNEQIEGEEIEEQDFITRLPFSKIHEVEMDEQFIAIIEGWAWDE